MAQAEHLPITRTPARHQRGMTCSVLVSVCATEKTRRPVLVAEHAQEISVDGKRLAVVGNSVGGNKAAVVSLMAKDRGTPKIKYQVLLWPVTDANFQNASYHQFAEGHFLTRNMMKWFWDNYTPDPKQRQDAYASPLQATTERLRDLPPALTLTGLLGLASPQLSALGSGAFGSAGLALAAPLFDAQALGFQQRAAEAQAKQVLAQYQDDPGSFQGGRRCSRRGGNRPEQTEAQESQVASLRSALHLAKLRYKGGLSNYLDVLTAKRDLFDAELALTATQRLHLVSIVQLYKALGGGWSPSETLQSIERIR